MLSGLEHPWAAVNQSKTDQIYAAKRNRRSVVGSINATLFLKKVFEDRSR